MPELTTPQLVQLIVFALCVGAYTIAAAVWDIRVKKIPNKLTLPVFGLGLVYQIAFNGLSGLGDAGLGFLLGFGLLFLLWMIGTGGGGDVKLIGGLSVWLGWKMTGFVLLGSTGLAAFGTFFILAYSMLFKGVFKTKDKFTSAAARDLKKGEKIKRETVQDRVARRPMGFAVPVALATWLVVVWQLPKFPWV
jgi:prepilin peptidase CpaA